MAVAAELRRQVIDRAGGVCEYCRMAPEYDEATFQIDHVRPERLGGRTDLANLAYACFPCNNAKGPNIAGIDPQTDAKTFLFDPRVDAWHDHFVLTGPFIEGRTDAGRATADLLRVNAPHRITLRRQLLDEGVRLA